MSKGRGTIKPRELEIILKKLTFRRLECDHHVRAYLEVDGKKILTIHYSFGRNDIYGRVLKNIIRDLHVTEETFFGLIECHVSQGDYIKILRDKRII